MAGPSTEKRLFLFLLRTGWLKPAQLLNFLRFGVTHAALYGRHTWKKNKAYLGGLPCAGIEALVSGWVRQAAPDWWFAPCVARLREHQRAGDTVVLLTGTPQFVAEALALELGASRALGTVCASEAGTFLAGPPLRHPFGSEKLELLVSLCTELRVDARDLHVYGDSLHDLPVLRHAGHPVAVRPDPGLRSAAGAAGWEIIGRR